MKRSRVRRAAVVGLLAALAASWSPARSRVLSSLTSGTLIASSTPTAPRSPTAIPGNAWAAVSFLAPASNGGSPITGYIVTPHLGSVAQVARVFTSTARTQSIGGLANAKTYTFDVAARNGLGVGPRSARTAPITVGAPTSPRAPRATPGNGSARLVFAAPLLNNGAAITGYTVTPYLANIAQRPRVFNSTATTEVVGGLVNAKSYQFRVAAKNARGMSAPSVATSATVGAPTAPSRVTARPSNGSATTRWTPPSTNNGSSISGYTISVYLSGAWQRDINYRSTATSRTITGLTGAGAYAFRIAAQNARGIGPRSVPSCVPMSGGQADINSQPAGTRFCLSGTHNWTLRPKTGDMIIGDGTAVLDGGRSTQYAVISAANQTNVTLSNFEVRNYTIKMDGQGAIRNADRSASGWVLKYLNVHDNGSFDGSSWNGAGADLGVNWLVWGGRYHDNRQEGLAGGDLIRNTTVDGAEIDHNNFTDGSHSRQASSCGHEAGGFKWIGDNITVKNSYVHDNACIGLWDDIDSNGAVITNNRIINNWNSGILHEVSRGATITHNTVRGNGFKTFNNNPPGCNPGWGGGISVSDSGHTGAGEATVEIAFNIVSGNCNGITGLDAGASGGSCGTGCTLAHVHVHDNIVVGSSNPLANNNSGNFEWDDNGDVANRDNTFANNTYSGGINFCRNAC